MTDEQVLDDAEGQQRRLDRFPPAAVGAGSGVRRLGLVQVARHRLAQAGARLVLELLTQRLEHIRKKSKQIKKKLSNDLVDELCNDGEAPFHPFPFGTSFTTR